MKRMNSSLYSNYPGVIHPILSSRPKCGKKLNKCCSSNNTDDLCLSFSHCPPSTVFSVAEMEQGFIIYSKIKKNWKSKTISSHKRSSKLYVSK